MPYLFFIMSFFFVSLSFASPIVINSQLYHDGFRVGSPRIFASNGKSAKVFMNDQKREQNYSLEVYPKILGKKIQLKYKLAIKHNNSETISRGQIHVKQKEKGLIYLDKGRVRIHLEVKKS